MSVSAIYERLLHAVSLEGDEAGVRFRTTLQPTGGRGTRIMPPTYPGGYVITCRQLGEHDEMGAAATTSTVLLDSYQSQANRVEEGLLDARDHGRVALPLFEMRVDAAPWAVRLTSLDFPHRYADAYLRDSMLDGTRFDQTEIGRALRVAQPEQAQDLYRYDPVSLVLGAWNSHRDGRQPKFARCYKSECIGLDVQADERRGGRLDPMNLTGGVDDAAKKEGDWKFTGAGEKKKGGKLSEIGHGNALADSGGPGGVTVSEVRRLGALSFAALAKLRFEGASQEAALAARALLAALALVGDRLAFGRAGWVFRSGCELTVISDEVSWELRGGATDPINLSIADAVALFAHAGEAAAAVGMPISTETWAIEPLPELRKAIEFALVSASNGE